MVSVIDNRNVSAGIPVQNIWLLMLYASDVRFLANEFSDSENIDENVADLVANILCQLMAQRLKQNLTYG